MAKRETHLQVFDDNSQLSVPEGPFTELRLFTPKQGVSQDRTKNPGLNLSELVSQEPYITAASFCSVSQLLGPADCVPAVPMPDRNYSPWENLECSL